MKVLYLTTANRPLLLAALRATKSDIDYVGDIGPSKFNALVRKVKNSKLGPIYLSPDEWFVISDSVDELYVEADSLRKAMPNLHNATSLELASGKTVMVDRKSLPDYLRQLTNG